HGDTDWWCAGSDGPRAVGGVAHPPRPPTSDSQTHGATNADTRLCPTAPSPRPPDRGGTPFCARWAGSDRGPGRARGAVYTAANTAEAGRANAGRASRSDLVALSLDG